MKISDFQNTLPALLDTGVSLEIISAPGMGKSEVIKDSCRALTDRDGDEWGYITLFLATQTPSDLYGYMVPQDAVINDQPTQISAYTMPPWMRTTDGRTVHEFTRGVLFLDEYGQGDSDVKRASAELLLNRQLGPWKLPDGWSVVAASNRATDRSGVGNAFDFVINRRIEIHLQPDPQGWEQWAIKNKINPIVISFARENIPVVFSGNIPEKQGPWCTPRSLVMAHNVLRSLGGGVLADHDIANEVCAGLIGDGATAQLMAHIKLSQDCPSIEQVAADPKACTVPASPAARMLMVYKMAASVNAKNFAALAEYLDRLGADFGVTFFRACFTYNPMLATSDVVGAWTKKNANLASVLRQVLT